METPTPTGTPVPPPTASHVLVPVLANKMLRAWPKHRKGGHASYMPIDVALTRTYPGDAHFAAYCVPSILRRLDHGALQLADEDAKKLLPDGVPMRLAVFDVDCELSHAASGGKGGTPAPDSWWVDSELAKIEALRAAHAGAFVYRTRGGYRLVCVLAEPTILRAPADAATWTNEYLTWCAYLARCYAIHADPACKEWQRLYRLPHATREEGGRPEARETIGDATAIGTWAPVLTDADRETAKAIGWKAPAAEKPRKARAAAPATASDRRGVLYFAFLARGSVGAEIEPGKWAVKCPNDAAHTTGDPMDGSTVLWAPGDGESLGYMHCSHAHCQGRTVRDTLAALSDAELDAAKQAAGLATRRRTGQARPSTTATRGGNGQTVRAADGTTATETDGEPAERLTADAIDDLPYVLVPGPHVTGDGEEDVVEQGADDFAREALDAIPEDVLYRWDCVVGRIIGEAGERRFTRVSEHELRTIIDAHARLTKWIKVENPETGEEMRVPAFVACSRDLAALVLAAAGSSSRVRSLTMIARYPVYQPGLTLVSPGWNESGVYYDEPPDIANLAPRAEGAVAVLDDLVIDFPFGDAASRHNVYGAVLTLLLRPAIEGPIPIHLVMAPMERVGKGLCIDTAIGYPVLGRGVTVAQIGSSEEEREKRITTLILQGATAIHLDNLPVGEVLDSASLASLATAYPTWSGRVLGVSRMPELPNRIAVIISANNPKASGEIVKRTVPIVLRPLDAHPENRTGYQHPDATAYALSKRRVVLEALIGMIDAWRAAGRPPAPADRRMGRYEAWVAAVGGVLTHAGCSEWLANYRAWVRCGDEATADAETLIAAWAERHGQKDITARQILDLVETTGTYPAVTSRPEAGRLVSLARRVLTPLTDRPVGGWIVRRVGSGSSSRYRLTAAIPTPSAGVSGESGVLCRPLTHEE